MDEELEDEIEEERRWLKKEFGEGDELLETLSVKYKEQIKRSELQREHDRKFIRHLIIRLVLYLVLGIIISVVLSFLLFESLGDLIIFPSICVAIIVFLGRLSLHKERRELTKLGKSEEEILDKISSNNF